MGSEDVSFDSILSEDFYARDAHDVARDLLGQLLVRPSPEGTVVGRIVELEVYGGVDDPACHADSGRPTARTRSMFGEPGTAYVYKIYGMYNCLNVVAPRGDASKPSAILLRALEPVFGLELMAQRRRLEDVSTPRNQRKLLSGPGKLCQAFDVDRELDGVVLQGPPLYIARGETVPAGRVALTPRVGLNPQTCGDSTHFEWRYVVEDSPHRSR